MMFEIAINAKKKDDGGKAEHSLNDDKGIRLLLTYLRLRLVVEVVQSTAAMILNLTIEQHLPLIHHFHGRDLILIREMIAKEIK